MRDGTKGTEHMQQTLIFSYIHTYLQPDNSNLGYLIKIHSLNMNLWKVKNKKNIDTNV